MNFDLIYFLLRLYLPPLQGPSDYFHFHSFTQHLGTYHFGATFWYIPYIKYTQGAYTNRIHICVHLEGCTLHHLADKSIISSGSSGRVRGGAEKHEIYAAAFGGHLFITYFHRARGAMDLLPPPPIRYWLWNPVGIQKCTFGGGGISCNWECYTG